MLRNLHFTSFDLVKNLFDIFVYQRVLAKTKLVAVGGKLLRGGSGRLPLISPNRLIGACGRKMPTMALVVVAIQGKAKPTHASEKLGNTNSHIETPHLGQFKKNYFRLQ